MSSRSSSSPAADAGARDEPIVLARLGRPRGTRGEIGLHLETDRPEVVLAAPGSYRLDDGRLIEVEELIERNGRWFWVVAGRPAREDLADYVNHDILVDPDALPARGEGEIDEHRLIGCRVIDRDQIVLGEVTGVERRYEIDTWLLRLENGRPAEIPAVAAFVHAVDLEARTVTVDPAGILR